MAGLQRSAVSFRRQGSSGIVWDDRFLSGELNQPGNQQKEGEEERRQRKELEPEVEKVDNKDIRPSRIVAPVNTIERSRSNGGARGYRTGKVSPAIEPPSPKVSACGFCSVFAKPNEKNHRKKPGKRRSR